jgi:hypothetical protein
MVTRNLEKLDVLFWPQFHGSISDHPFCKTGMDRLPAAV